LLGEPLEGKLHEWFLWGGTGDGPSRKVRHRASSLPDSLHFRDTKDPRFGLGMGESRISSPERRDRLCSTRAHSRKYRNTSQI
jgi:hypothetical protein